MDNVHPTFRPLLQSVKGPVGRVCAVCGKRDGRATYGFQTILARNGIKGDKAHKECIASLRHSQSAKACDGE